MRDLAPMLAAEKECVTVVDGGAELRLEIPFVEKADIGLALDGDADRLLVVDQNGDLKGLITVKDIKTTGKTKDIAGFLADNKLTGKVLLVVDEKSPELIRATNNLENVLLVGSTYISVFRILNADAIVIAPAAIKTIKDWLVAEEAKS